jgi:DNA-binding NtrC family response regulator
MFTYSKTAQLYDMVRLFRLLKMIGPLWPMPFRHILFVPERKILSRRDLFMHARIIVVDDDKDYMEILSRHLMDSGYQNIQTEENPEKAAVLFEQGEVFDIAIVDMTMPEMDGMALLEIIKNFSPETECIMVTAVNEARVAVGCLKVGAYDYLVKPISKDELNMTIRRALERKRLLDILEFDNRPSLPGLIHEGPFKHIITSSRNMLKVMKAAELHATGDVPVLITGESGTGKELLARAIHNASPRAGKPFTAVNMASLTGGLFDAEFFGHTRGAFTGAEKNREGYLEYTSGGTLFLDEIGILPVELQGKLLRVLQSGEYLKIGASDQQTANVRFVAATNENLSELIDRKLFRKDLYYRLRGSWLHIPPLRDRKDDIPLLINHFIQKFCGIENKCTIEEKAIDLLMGYHYPGNVRELMAIIQSAVSLARGRAITPQLFPDELRTCKAAPRITREHTGSPVDVMATLAEVEKNHILHVYESTGCNKSETARRLEIGLNTLRRKLQTYGIK